MAKGKPWIRLYTEIPNDPKVQSLPPNLFRFWINCLCLAGRNDGILPSDEHISWSLRESTSKVSEMLQRLIDRHLLDEVAGGGGFQPHGWSGRQYEGDNSTGRVNEYRQRVREAGRTVGGYLKYRPMIFARDCGRCIYCGSGQNLCIDHVVPVILGGDDDPENLATACKSCNAGKAGRTPDGAGMEIVTDCHYSAIYHRNLSRLHVTVTVTGGVTATPPEQSRAEQNRTEANRHGLIDPNSGFDFEEWFESRFKRHPNKKQRSAAFRNLAELGEVRKSAWRAEFERVHELWIETEGWNWKGGVRAPTFAEWVIDSGWKYEPTQSARQPQYISATEEMT